MSTGTRLGPGQGSTVSARNRCCRSKHPTAEWDWELGRNTVQIGKVFLQLHGERWVCWVGVGATLQLDLKFYLLSLSG